MVAQTIPVLDLVQYKNEKETFVRALGDGYKEFGFCGITSHGVADSVIDEAFQASRELFELPESIKSSYIVPITGGARGYTGFGIEVAKDHNHPDLKEFWHVGREIPLGKPPHESLLPNVWPDEVVNFKSRIYPLYEALDQLGGTLLSALALYLGLDASYFENKINYGNSVLRALHYPPVKQSDMPSVRAGAHEDINLITLLVGSEQSGLEILTRDKQWIPVSTIPGTIVVNIGDMLQRLTNHVLVSTTHRVVNSDEKNADQSRYSIPFFLHPNHDFVIETLPQCISEEHPNRYPNAIGSDEYLAERLREIGLL